MEFLFIWGICSMIGFCFQILIQPAELLQFYARAVNMANINPNLKKLLVCPHCVSGQIAFWTSIIDILLYNVPLHVFISVPLTIITVYHYARAYHSQN